MEFNAKSLWRLKNLLVCVCVWIPQWLIYGKWSRSQGTPTSSHQTSAYPLHSKHMTSWCWPTIALTLTLTGGCLGFCRSWLTGIGSKRHQKGTTAPFGSSQLSQGRLWDENNSDTVLIKCVGNHIYCNTRGHCLLLVSGTLGLDMLMVILTIRKLLWKICHMPMQIVFNRV